MNDRKIFHKKSINGIGSFWSLSNYLLWAGVITTIITFQTYYFEQYALCSIMKHMLRNTYTYDVYTIIYTHWIEHFLKNITKKIMENYKKWTNSG